MKSIHDRNESMAFAINQKLSEKKVFTINLMGAPGTGKTSSIIELEKEIKSKIYVIEGDIESDIDTLKLFDKNIPSYQINTGGACHLDAPLIEKAVYDMTENLRDLFTDCFLFIENIGNLVCPAEFVIGEHIKILICSVTDGSDKPYKYPLAFEKADLILLNKIDLIPYVNFDDSFFQTGVRSLNENAPIFPVSATKGKGFGEVALWLKQKKKILFAES